MDQMKKRWHRYHYKNLTYLFISLVFSYILFHNQLFQSFITNLGSLGYIGAFIAGMLYASTFTLATGIAVLILLSKHLSPVEICFIAAAGAVISDFTIFHLMRTKGLVNEVKHIFHHFGGIRLPHLLRTKYFSWSLPVIGALIIISPIPDEFGVSLMGISKMTTLQFLISSFLLNTLGIFLFVSSSFFIKI